MRAAAFPIALMLAAPAAAQPQVPQLPPATPSLDAVALAHALRSTPSATAVARLSASLAKSLPGAQAAWRGPSCDPGVAACRAAAEKIGRDAAPALLEAQENLKEQVRAARFDALMSPAEIVAAQRFAATREGRSFVRALAFDGTELTDAERLRLSQLLVQAPRASAVTDMINRFYDATVTLPRAKIVVPPPPMPSPRPAQPASKP